MKNKIFKTKKNIKSKAKKNLVLIPMINNP